MKLSIAYKGKNILNIELNQPKMHLGSAEKWCLVGYSDFLYDSCDVTSYQDGSADD